MKLSLHTIKRIIGWVAAVFILLFGFGLITSGGSVIYMARMAFWGRTDTGDVNRFATRTILNHAPASVFETAEIEAPFKTIAYTWKDQELTGDLDTLMQDNGTTALIVISNGVIRLERYYNGASRNTLNTSFSVAKSFDSVLIGIAINEGYIQDVNDPIVEYLPELAGHGLDGITIRQLLNMSTGIRYVNGAAAAPFYWMSDDFFTYYMPDLRELALKVTPSREQPGEKFHYNNYHPILEGLILERVTGMTVSNYLQDKIWKPLGMQYPASWSLDSKLDGFEKMASGLNARSIDYARFGQLLLNGGMWNGLQLIPQGWVEESTSPDLLDRRPWMDFTEFKESGGYYKYHWWGQVRPDGHYDYFAYGSHGQYIYICPTHQIVIVRNGSTEGSVDDWPALFAELEDKLVATQE
jgi:CubicO group peptidase (beta-lactamase class C family)